MLISIITVTYNAEKTLSKLLGGTKFVLESYEGIEHVIVDGASTDRTVQLASSYASSVRNVKFVSEPDNGIYNAMNKGLGLSSGQYILHLNGDDWIDDLANFEALYATLKKERPLVLSSPVAIYEGQDVYRLLPAKPLNGFHARFGFHFPHQGTLFSRELFELTQGYSEDIGYVADKVFCFQLLDVLPLASVLCFDKLTFAQAAGGVSSRSRLTPIQTFMLTVRASRRAPFKHPVMRAFFNLVFKFWMLISFRKLQAQ